ncbi:MEDS domain-containing protein [Streptomyces sp. NPDC015131]|uniref:MEDS domain-containing protein n=1 Tax=Streptomyces sp. NPDC015131 TaxID=3364941 RepID=UPI003701F2BE
MTRVRGAGAPHARLSAAEQHTSVVFSDDREWAEQLCTFVRAGLDRGEQVQYFADATEPARVLAALSDGGVDVPGALSRGQLTVSTAAQTYLAQGGFDPDAMMGLWADALDDAFAQGHNGMRAIGEMSWGVRDIAGADRLLEYELRIHDEVFARLPLTAWCFYDRRLLPEAYLDVLTGAHLTHRGETLADPVLQVAPLADHPGFRLSGSAGYDTREVVTAAAAAVRGAAAPRVELDLADLRHLDAASLAALADAAASRTGGDPVLLRQPPPTLRRLLDLFPTLGTALEVVDR